MMEAGKHVIGFIIAILCYIYVQLLRLKLTGILNRQSDREGFFAKWCPKFWGLIQINRWLYSLTRNTNRSASASAVPSDCQNGS